MYKLVGDPQELENFVKTLPELKENELYFMALFVRKKYMPERAFFEDETPTLPSSIQLWRSGVKKEHLIKSVYQIQQRLSGFTHNSLRIPPEAFALYIHPNPRDNRLASSNMALAITKRVLKNHPMPHIQSEAKTFLQKAKSRSVFSHFDYDNVGEDFLLPKVMKYIDGKVIITNEDGVETVFDNTNNIIQAYKTRSGIHALVDNEMARKLIWWGNLDPLWYPKLKDIPECDEHGDFMLPMPGCFTGGNHIVRRINI